MPLVTRPNQTFEVVLSTDKKLPAEDQPVFIFRFVNCIEWEEIAKFNDEFEAVNDSQKMLDLAFAVIEKTLCGWQNMKMPAGEVINFNLKGLRALVTLQEAAELMMAAVAQRPTVDDKKKFELQSDSSTEASVKGAKEPTDAKTNQPQQSQ